MEAHRPVDTASADEETTFHEFVAFNGGQFAVFRARGEGAGPWEMHPDADELLFALEGSVTVDMFDHDGNQRGRSTPAVSSSCLGADGTVRRHRERCRTLSTLWSKSRL